MKYKELSSITDIHSGIIVHQVNCQNVMGAGVAKALYEAYPIIKEKYHAFCERTPKDRRLGSVQPVRIHRKLVVINLFTQEEYGNGKVTKRCYTDMDLLVQRLIAICNQNPTQDIYIPERIGCGLAGGDWNYVKTKLESANLWNLTVVTRPE